ncbi:MAG: hypothetical protein Q8O56_14330 [Solirubrobacteraceae bacterium]|nr:hypothetical protein [Solirubrobacteraceae bacterium]
MSGSGRSSRQAQVESQVNYHRQRLALYVKLHGDKPCQKLTQLEEAVSGAQKRLAKYSAEEDATAEA